MEAGLLMSRTPTLDGIEAHGNKTPALQYRGSNWITCADGFKVSVIAGPGCYCTPRVAIAGMFLPNLHEVAEDYPGPYTSVEVGYPSERPEPWHCTAWNDGFDRHEDHPVCDGWESWGDEDGGIYGYVPVAAVRALLLAHGGEAVVS